MLGGNGGWEGGSDGTTYCLFLSVIHLGWNEAQEAIECLGMVAQAILYVV